MVCARPANATCKLFNSLIFADANFFITTIDTLGKPLLNDHNNWHNRLINFKTAFSSLLQNCATCPADSRIKTSDLVSLEIDPLNRNSALRQGSAFLSAVFRSCRAGESNTFFGDIRSIMNNHIATVVTDVATRDAIRAALSASDTHSVRNASNELSPNDFSIIAAALTQSNGRGSAFIITEDESLRKCVEYLYSKREVTIGDARLSTLQTFHWGIFKYSSCFHKCCLFSNDFQLRIIQKVTVSDIARQMRDEKRLLKSAHADEAFNLIIETINSKNNGGAA